VSRRGGRPPGRSGRAVRPAGGGGSRPPGGPRVSGNTGGNVPCPVLLAVLPLVLSYLLAAALVRRLNP